MNDDKTNAGGQDRTPINLSESFEVHDGARTFGVSKEDLTAADMNVGNKARGVEAHLKSPLEGTPTMNTCSCCGLSYALQGGAWGDACGDCIAAEIELMLMGRPPSRARMPMRRAPEPHVGVDREDVERAEGAQRQAIGE